jgi:hypothetical protein
VIATVPRAGLPIASQAGENRDDPPAAGEGQAAQVARDDLARSRKLARNRSCLDRHDLDGKWRIGSCTARPENRRHNRRERNVPNADCHPRHLAQVAPGDGISRQP